MDVERFFRDVSYAAGSDDPEEAFAAIAAIHGDHVRRFAAERRRMEDKFGAAGAQKFAEDMAVMAVSAAIMPVPDIDPMAAYFGYLAASSTPQRFAWWLDHVDSKHAAGVRRAASRVAPGAFAPVGMRVPARVFAAYHLGHPATDMLGVTDELVEQAAGGLVRSSSVDPVGVSVQVSGVDCPVSRGRSFPGLEIACRTASDLTGCAHFRGVGCDGHVRCAAQRVAQMAATPGNPMAPAPKPGDLLDIANRDGTKSKVRITRIDPDNKTVIEPTLG